LCTDGSLPSHPAFQPTWLNVSSHPHSTSFTLGDVFGNHFLVPVPPTFRTTCSLFFVGVVDEYVHLLAPLLLFPSPILFFFLLQFSPGLEPTCTQTATTHSLSRNVFAFIFHLSSTPTFPPAPLCHWFCATSVLITVADSSVPCPAFWPSPDLINFYARCIFCSNALPSPLSSDPTPQYYGTFCAVLFSLL